MKTKPIYFNFMSSFYLIVAMSFPIQIWMIYQVNDLNMIFSKMTYLNWFLVASFMGLSYLSYRASRLIIYLTPLVCASVFFNNWVVSEYGRDFSFGQTLASSIAFSLVCASIYSPRFLRLLSNQKNRWWEPAPRIKKTIPVHLIHDKNQINSISFDISESGIYIQENQSLTLSQIPIGKIIKMQIELPEGTINCSAEVVRKSNLADTNYPAGLGLRFLEPSAFLKQSINEELENSLIH